MNHYGISIKDIEPIAPFSQGSTERFLTGHWSPRKPMYAEKLSPCREACPVGNDIPTVLSLVSEGRFDEGLMTILKENPLPGVCGRVCYHPCQSNCNRIEFDTAIEIRSIERALSDCGSALPTIRKSSNPKTVAVIGSGPAGLSAAYFLARLGHKVTIFEARKEPGGVLRYGIPDYRLPKRVVKKEIARILSLGITLKTGAPTDQATLNSFKNEYDALFLSTGAWLPRTLHIDGKTGPAVLYGLDFLSSPAQRASCAGKSTVLVVGGGDVAIDVARCALRLCKPGTRITMVAPEDLGNFPAIPEAVKEALDEGIEMIGGYRPELFSGANVHMQVRFSRTRVEKDPQTGIYTMTPMEGKDLLLEADLVIVAIGQIPDLSLYTTELVSGDTGKIYTNEFGLTPFTNVYAGGDLIGQRPSVVDAVASGKKAAIAIDMEHRGLKRKEQLTALQLGGGMSLSAQAYMEGTTIDLKRIVPFDELNTLVYHKAEPHIVKYRPPKARIKDFGEINKSLDREHTMEEAKRCFYCGRCIGCDLCFLLCPDISITRSANKEYTINTDYCKGCNICVATCPRHVMETGGLP